MPGVFHRIAVLGPESLSRRPAHPPTAARRSHHVHEAAHTELLPHWDGRWCDGSHFAVSESPWTRWQGVGGRRAAGHLWPESAEGRATTVLRCASAALVSLCVCSV